MSLASQGRRKPTFDDAGKVNNKKEENKEELKQYVEPEEQKEEVPEEVNTIDSIVDSIVHAPKEKPKAQVSIYLDDDVKKAFDRFSKQNGKGARSNLVNNFLKKALKGYMK